MEFNDDMHERHETQDTHGLQTDTDGEDTTKLCIYQYIIDLFNTCYRYQSETMIISTEGFGVL